MPYNLRCLGGVRSGAHLEVNIRSWNIEIPEECTGHKVVVVLPGMNKKVLDQFARPGMAIDRH